MAFRQSGVTLASLGVSMPPYNAFTMALSAGDTTETYTFTRSGTQVAIWVLVYTDSNRTTLVSGLFKDLST